MTTLLLDVSQGVHDDLLDNLILAAQGRQAVLGVPITGRTNPIVTTVPLTEVAPPASPGFFRVGTKVQIKAPLKPRYLEGAPATVMRNNHTRCVIHLDADWLDAHPQAKARWDGDVTIRPAALELRPAE